MNAENKMENSNEQNKEIWKEYIVNPKGYLMKHSHADRSDFMNPLCKIIKQGGLKYWVTCFTDIYSIPISVNGKINEGLLKKIHELDLDISEIKEENKNA